MSVKKIRNIGDFEIAIDKTGNMMLYKRENNQKPQIIILTKAEQEKLKRQLL